MVSKPSKEEAEQSLIEEGLLSFFAVFVHDIAYGVEVEALVGQELFVLVVSVGVDQDGHELLELEGLRVAHFGANLVELLAKEQLDDHLHFGLLLLLEPLLLEGRKEVLVELAHKTEASSLVKEIETFVVLFRFGYLRGLLPYLLGLLLFLELYRFLRRDHFGLLGSAGLAGGEGHHFV
jgi:hypothetical protein